MEQLVRVLAEQHGERLDKFVAAQLPNLSRSFVQQLIQDGHVRVEGRARKSHYHVNAGETIAVEIPPPEAPDAQPENIPLDVLYQDDALLVINKPAGMVVHPAVGHSSGTLVNAVLGYVPEVGADTPERAGIVHRLDRDTSGLIVIARTAEALHALHAQFAARRVHKTYLALVHGRVKVPQGKIDAPIGRDPHDRKKMAVVTNEHGRAAVTIFRVLASSDHYTLLRVEPETGRTHQIRVHLAFIKHPVVADEIYGRKKNELSLTRQFLHAWRIELAHPVTGASLSFTARLPADLRAALEQAGMMVELGD